MNNNLEKKERTNESMNESMNEWIIKREFLMGIEIKCEIGGNQNFVLVDNFKEKKKKKGEVVLIGSKQI